MIKINSLAIFIPDIQIEPFAGIAKALMKGFFSSGIRDLYIVDLKAERDVREDEFPEGVEIIGLRTNRASKSAIALKKFIEQYRPDILISMPTTIKNV